MRLSEWLIKTGITAAEFARRIRKPQGTVARYVNGDRIPEAEAMKRIAKETNQQVRADDFYDLPPARNGR